MARGASKWRQSRAQHTQLAASFSIEALADTPIDVKDGSFRRWTIHDYTSRYKAGTATPSQVIATVLDAIDASNVLSPPLLAFVKVNRDAVLQEAAAATERYARGTPLGVLDGVPVAVKDELNVVGYTTSFGTSFMNDMATEDDAPIARLRQAGAIFVGKTNMHEIGMGTFGINIFTGTPRNPYNDQHMTGGSSSGSAAAVAAGLVPLAIGCDGGGSIRIPAGLCGIVGIKATYMRVPFHFQGGPSVANVGPLAATVQDLALAYAVLGGADPDQPLSVCQPPPFVLPPSTPPSLAGLRVGVFSAYVEGSDPQIKSAFWDTVAYLRELGATVVEVEIPHLQALHLSHSITILTEISLLMDTQPQHLFSPDVQIALALGQETLDSMDFLAAQKVRAYAMEATDDLFAQVDVFVTPTTATLAPRLENDVFKAGLSELSLTTALMRYILLGNMVGIPGLSVPVGYATESNLPVSMLFQAKHWNEHVLFDVARLVEAHAVAKKPSVYYSILE
ncbi:hypothetical protein H257_05433 [Aphanomyces astaci]|uniref:Amidase domain-containing protein n=1 Tax=Aphanomyces astaci TaxID=112090 RepID=W4GS80_APHAT|nr:hypothetical protein H257_05433 [Aphanomyces astaci]ETV81879.1 hypothetical protein H257_05433 [Aphanomyces astaci]|eukprot:XP_009828616.1 hypothetical protein H257_05433 [Aphanomyces astaci]